MLREREPDRARLQRAQRAVAEQAIELAHDLTSEIAHGALLTVAVRHALAGERDLMLVALGALGAYGLCARVPLWVCFSDDPETWIN